MSTVESILQFSPLQSFVNPTFWHKFAEIKLDKDRLSDAPKEIKGFYTNRDAKSCLLEVDYSAFNKDFIPHKFNYEANGIIYNKNTIEEFKTCDKKDLLQTAGYQLINHFKSDDVFLNETCLSNFMILSFADLKTYNYYYWFAFPCPLTETPLVSIGEALKVQDIPQLNAFLDCLKNFPLEQQNYFIYQASANKCYSLRDGILHLDDLADIYFAFADPSESEHPSWLMRVYATFIFYKCSELIGKKVKFLGLRYNKKMDASQSLVWNVKQNTEICFDENTQINFVGWEVNQSNRMGPRMVSMRENMDPKILADNLTQLNLKLMKWRMLPELNLDILSATKCLLFGAGTLGCAVARCLLGWGFKHITFVDNGRVGYSNPTRQCLYTHADAQSGKTMKATTAADRVKEINPNVNAMGYALQIPMPSHPIGETLKEQTIQDLQTIIQLIENHDVVFLLTDSRESRWLPTLIGAVKQKLIITVALGFDSYMVMRHGSTKPHNSIEPQQVAGLKSINGSDLSCYFCTNVTAPGNSIKDRTLDQQCTVTRPGVSNIAASYAVELLVALLQHKDKDLAPAYYCYDAKASEDIPEGMLGILPHTIRGQLSRFENIFPATEKFKQCTACSEAVLNEFKENGNEFLFKVFESSKYLEDLTGINEYEQLSTEMMAEFEDGMLIMSDEENDC